MITDIQRATPYIDFGFGFENISVAVDESFTVWVNTLYNENEYVIILPVTSEATIDQVSPYEFILSYDTAGEYDLQLNVNSKNGFSLVSNTITVTVA